MPNRLLREGITTSDRIESLSEAEEVFYYRLLVVADDFGRMDARPAILKAQCFPLRDSATPARIEQWLAALAEKGLIVRYSSPDGAPLLAVNRWEQRVRSRARYAGPSDAGWQTYVGQVSDNVPAYDRLGKGKGKGKGATSRHGRELLPLPPDWVPSENTVAAVSREFGLRVPEDVDRYVAAFRDACASKGYVYRDHDAAFRNCVRQDWPKLRGAVIPLKAARGPVL